MGGEISRDRLRKPTRKRTAQRERRSLLRTTELTTEAAPRFRARYRRSARAMRELLYQKNVRSSLQQTSAARMMPPKRPGSDAPLLIPRLPSKRYTAHWGR